MTSCASLNPSPTDSFCTTYQPLQGTKGVGSILALQPIKDRIAANEKTYLCNCTNSELKAKLCRSKS
jgi:hypothetical protein